MVHDWILALVVLLLVCIDLLILTLFMVIEGIRGNLNSIEVQDRESPMSTVGVSN